MRVSLAILCIAEMTASMIQTEETQREELYRMALARLKQQIYRANTLCALYTYQLSILYLNLSIRMIYLWEIFIK